jgi:hypothetical protein
MRKINTKRFIAAALLAGVAINVLHGAGEALIAAELEATLARLGLVAPSGPALAVLALAGFALGLAAVWLYVALRPFYGAGPATALRAGLAVWLLACVLPNVSLAVFGMISGGFLWQTTVIDLVTVTAAALVGGRLYRDTEPATHSAPTPAVAR